MSQVLRPITETVIWKETESDQLTDLREPPREAGCNLGIKMLVAAISGSSSHREDCDASKHHFGIFLLA